MLCRKLSPRACRHCVLRRAPQVQASAGGKMPSLTGHLWLGAQDAEAAATSLAPKLRKSQAEVSRLLAEACSLEVQPCSAVSPCPDCSMAPMSVQLTAAAQHQLVCSLRMTSGAVRPPRSASNAGRSLSSWPACCRSAGTPSYPGALVASGTECGERWPPALHLGSSSRLRLVSGPDSSECRGPQQQLRRVVCCGADAPVRPGGRGVPGQPGAAAVGHIHQDRPQRRHSPPGNAQAAAAAERLGTWRPWVEPHSLSRRRRQSSCLPRQGNVGILSASVQSAGPGLQRGMPSARAAVASVCVPLLFPG